MKKIGIIITGSNGFIGSRLTKKIEKQSLIFIDRKNKNNLKFVDHNNLTIKNLNHFDSILIFHLSTYFSLDDAKKDKVFEANVSFTNNLLDLIDDYDVKKIIYTNSMYNFYKDPNLRDSFYTKTKNECAKNLEYFCDKNNSIFEEIFLDNTFGEGDKREKIIPLIVKSIIQDSENPIINKNGFINLTHVDDVVDRLLISREIFEKNKSAFIPKYMVNLNSIYHFLLSFYIQNQPDKEILTYKKNDYINMQLLIDNKNINLDNLNEKLVLLLQNA